MGRQLLLKFFNSVEGNSLFVVVYIINGKNLKVFCGGGFNGFFVMV